MRLFLKILAVSLTLISCQAVTVQHGPVAVQYSNLPANLAPGIKLKLQKNIIIPGGSASVHIQDGETKPQQLNPVENYRPYCIIEVKHRLASTQTITPDTFEVTRVILDEEAVSLFPRLASLAMNSGAKGLYLGSGGHTAVVFATIMDLSSGNQPEVTRLICQQWDDPAIGVHLTVQEISQALNGLMILEGEFPSQ
jgi:hypothetical protein